LDTVDELLEGEVGGRAERDEGLLKGVEETRGGGEDLGDGWRGACSKGIGGGLEGSLACAATDLLCVLGT
jgi:hypothetical protein